MRLSDKIVRLRKEKGWSQETLAEKLNVSRQAITKWETGEGSPDIENLKNIALYFHVSVDYLVGSTTEKIINGGKNSFNQFQNFCLLLIEI